MGERKDRSRLPEDAGCWNCRFCDFSDGFLEHYCDKIDHLTMADALCTCWEKRYFSVAEFQKDYPSRKQREEKLKDMTDAEIDVLIDSCGIIQGKIYYSKFKKGRA